MKISFRLMRTRTGHIPRQRLDRLGEPAKGIDVPGDEPSEDRELLLAAELVRIFVRKQKEDDPHPSTERARRR